MVTQGLSELESPDRIFENSIGMYGKMGKIITLFRLYKDTKKVTWKESAETLLEEAINECNESTPIGYGNGLCGFGFGIEWLIQNGCIDGNADDILYEIDDKITAYLQDCQEVKTDIREGWLGIAVYFHQRLHYRQSLTNPRTIELLDSTNILMDKITNNINNNLTIEQKSNCKKAIIILQNIKDSEVGKMYNTLPLVSVILPVFNTEKYLDKCLDSIISQNISNFEVIIVNDGSTDGSSEILKQISCHDKRFHYIEQTNQGISSARNTGLEQAKGKYIVFVDSDDWLEKDALNNLCRQAELTNADIVIGNTRAILKNGNTFMYGKEVGQIFAENKIMSGSDCFINIAKIGNPVPMVYNYLYRRSYIEENHFRFMKGLIHEDELWTPQVIISARRITCINDCHYNYLHHRVGSIMQATETEERINSLKIIIHELLEFSSRQNKRVIKEALNKTINMLQQILNYLAENKSAK